VEHLQMMESKVKGERQVWEAERQEWQARVSNFHDKHEHLERDHQVLSSKVCPASIWSLQDVQIKSDLD
jgi:ferredoxin-like protein FixX